MGSDYLKRVVGNAEVELTEPPHIGEDQLGRRSTALDASFCLFLTTSIGCIAMQRPVGTRLTHKITSFGWLKRVLSYLISRRSRNICARSMELISVFSCSVLSGRQSYYTMSCVTHCWPRSAAGSTIDWCRRRSFNMFTIRQARRVTLTAKNRILVVTRYSVVQESIDVVVEAGETLFLPVGWWCHTLTLGISITIALTNFIYPNHYEWE